MRSTILYTDKNLSFKQSPALRRKFWQIILEMGPWLPNLDMISISAGRPNTEKTIGKFISHLQEAGRQHIFRYIVSNGQIFIIRYEPVEYNKYTPQSLAQEMDGIWEKRIAAINDCLPKYLRMPELAKIKFRVSSWDNIKENRYIFPERIADKSGVIVNNYNEFIFAGYELKGQYKYIDKETSFSIYDAPLPKLGDTENSIDIRDFLLGADKRRANLQPLPANILEDNTQGHWDLFWPEGKKPADEWHAAMDTEPLEARDPSRDI